MPSAASWRRVASSRSAAALRSGAFLRSTAFLRHIAASLARLLPWAGAAASGLCLYASFAPLRLWYAAFAGIALFVAVLRGRGVWTSLGLGICMGFVFFATLTDWASEAAGTFIARLGLGLVMALYTGVLAVVWRRLIGRFGDRPSVLAPVLALTWVAMEQVRGSWPVGGMPWGTLAFGQVEGPLLRIAPYGSAQAVGAAVVVIGVLLESAARAVVQAVAAGRAMAAEKSEERAVTAGKASGRAMVRGRFARALLPFAGAAFLTAAPVLLPFQVHPEGSLTVAFVQGHIPSAEELSQGQSRALTVTQNLADQTRQVEGRGADLVLWPESASDYDAHTDPAARRIIEEVSSRLQVPLLLGTQRYPGDHRYNDYIVWMPGQGPTARYTKLHPVPFAEYMPARGFFRLLTSAVDQITIDMRPGRGPALLRVDAGGTNVALATPICFEIAYTPIVADAVRGGAQLIVLPTNNASFGYSAESFQQFDMARFQAAASGRTAIQVSTVGVSGIAEPDGSVRELTQPWQATSRVAEVQLSNRITVASKFERQISAAVYLSGLAVAGLALLRRPLTRAGLRARRRAPRAKQERQPDEGSRHHPDLQRV